MALGLLVGVACGTGVQGREPAIPAAEGVQSLASAAERRELLTPAARAFDGQRALEHVRRMVELGPRPSGSGALEETRRYIEEEVGRVGLEVRRQEFTATTPVGPIPMANLLVEVPPVPGSPEGPAIILAGHYDTKRFDAFRFAGANDGGSSAAILVEFARVLAEQPPPLPVWLVFFDGEEAVVEWTAEDSLYGSREMVRRLREDDRLAEIGALILLDMVADADLRIDRELHSTGWLIDLIWTVAGDIGHGDHFGRRGAFISDDHVPFLEAGVPAVDLIDFSYGPGNRYWHSPFDTLDKLSADSLQVVGEVVLTALPRLAARIARGQ